MRFMLTALVVAFWGLTTGAADDEKYKSEDGKYTIQFPKGAKVKTETKKTAAGLEMFMATADAGDGKACVVLYMDVPALKMVPPKVLFDGAEKGAPKKNGDKVEGSKDFEFGKDKLPGREFIVVSENGRKLKTQMIVSGTRAYTIMVGDPKDFATSKEATKVFESFEITT
jgi:hypothetical protein